MAKSYGSIFAVAVFLATSAMAQEGVRAEAQSLINTAGLTIQIPEDATEDQMAQVIALLQGSSENASTLEPQIKDVLGME